MSKRRRLAEWEAWDVIAAQFLRRAPNDPNLCEAVSTLEMDGRITEETEHRMLKRVDNYMHRSKSGYAYEVECPPFFVGGGPRWANDTSPEARRARAMAALWLALDAAWEASDQAIVDFRRATGRHGAVVLGNLETF